jgi:alanine dehydrogenase
MGMKQGSVVVDVSIDQGGCFESSELTSHEHPTFVKHGVIHYCVPNIPSRVSRTASFSLSNVLGQLLIEIGDCGGVEEVLRRRPGVRSGLYLYNGILTSPALGTHFDLPFSESDLLFQ